MRPGDLVFAIYESNFPEETLVSVFVDAEQANREVERLLENAKGHDECLYYVVELVLQ